MMNALEMFLNLLRPDDVFAGDAYYQMMFDQMNQIRLKVNVVRSHEVVG